ncbi:MAG: inorganic triphosphatase, partial [Burkholderiales bacterium]
KSKRKQAYKKRMSALQDLLGVRNDIVVAKTYLKELQEETGPDAEQSVEFIRGWYARDASAADKAISKSLKKFKRTEPFWN